MTDSPKYLDIAVPTPLRQSFQYLVPRAATGALPAAGIRVRVPFGRRSEIGILLGSSHTPKLSPEKIRPASALLDETPVLTASILKLCQWAADYYHHPIGEVLFAALPNGIRQGEQPDQPVDALVLTDAGKGAEDKILQRAPRQRNLFETLRRDDKPVTRTEIRALAFDSAVTTGLVTKGLAAWISIPAVRQGVFDPSRLKIVASGMTLTAEQQDAIAAIRASQGGVSLLYGITGSGKTEVYLQLIEAELKAGRQALVLVPEIGLTPQTVRRFSERFNVDVVALHSGLTDKERMQGWLSARAGTCGIVIGTRSAVFTPLKRPGLIVVDEEHDGSFKQQDGFRYHARDLAVMRGQMEDIPVVLGSATPSLESWHNAKTGKYRFVELKNRPGASELPRYQVINIRNQPLSDGFAPSLLNAIEGQLQAGNQVLVFLNRRGYAPVLLCRQCAWMSQCRRCDARMTFHQDQGRLICHHCGSEAVSPARCPACSSDTLVPLGFGTQRLEQAVQKRFPAFPVLRIDRDSTRKRHAMAALVDEINKGNPTILIGTQLLAKGHHFPNVTLVAIVDMDAGFYSANYKSAERTGQLILQVGGRAGRASKPGTVVIQTHLPDQPMFRCLIESGYTRFADELLAERSAQELPPFCHHALIRAEAGDRAAPTRFLESIARDLGQSPSVQVLGPVPATMERRAGKFRSHLLITSANRKSLQVFLRNCIRVAEAAADARKVRWALDVDPVDLF